jgi:DNA-binding NarL/FixJ family response regulator
MEPSSTESDPIRVLVVDDHEVVHSGLYAFLDDEPDLKVVGDAAGGHEAPAALAELQAQGNLPEVVLMDLKMARFDGVEATRRGARAIRRRGGRGAHLVRG